MKEIPNTNFAELILKDIFRHSVSYYPNGQKKSEQFYTDGIILLKEVHYNEDGRIIQICNYKANTNEVTKYNFGEERQKSGMLLCYHDNGKVQSQKYFVEGKINWEEKMFDQSGELLEVISYQKGIKTGPHRIYTENGILISEINFNKNIPDGISKFYYDSGMTKAIINYKDGKKHGVSKIFYENGILNIEENFDNDILNGDLKTFYTSGGLKENWNLHNGLPEGNCSFYYRTGKIYGTKNYKNGKEEGVARFYYENGKIKEEINYSNGIKNGHHRTYNLSGGIEKEYIFDNGTLISESSGVPVKKEMIHPVETMRTAAMRTFNYIGLSVATLVSIYFLYTLVLYLFG